MDFLKIATEPSKKNGTVVVFPKFIMKKSEDLMIRAGDFYAVWLEDKQLWSTEEQDVIEAIDKQLDDYAKKYSEQFNCKVQVKYMWDSDSGSIDSWHKYCQQRMRDNWHPLNENLVFANQSVNKLDYSTQRLPYALEPGDTSAWDSMMSVLYSPAELRKIEWAIGCIVSGDSKKVQKFLVLYGSHGTGKSTVLNIVQKLFDGYYSTFDAKSLGSKDAFALEAFKNNPLIAIQHDGDLSKIEDNTKLNSVISHEYLTVNEKHKSLYQAKFISFLMLGTNNPVKITDEKSGIIRRLIDVRPTGKTIPRDTYEKLNNTIGFELGAIAYKCKELYLSNPKYYDDYIPMQMMGETNDFYDFVEDSAFTWKTQGYTTLSEAWDMYQKYCTLAKVPFPHPRRIVRYELQAYFENYYDNYQNRSTGEHIRNYYTGFKAWMFDGSNSKAKHDVVDIDGPHIELINFKEQQSALDILCKDCPAQYANSAETPSKKWENVDTTLNDINTSHLHYLKVPENLIVIDFDLKDSDGKKDFRKNLEEASKWPATYAELSKSGSGIHLHYIYDGDPKQLSRIYDDNIEIKVFTGNSSLRRKLTKCNDVPINHIGLGAGLPLKGDKKTLADKVINDEKHLRALIRRSLNKEYGATRPSIDFIKTCLDEAYASGMKYDVSDYYNAILTFAAQSTHQSEYCLNQIPLMHFKSEEPSIGFSDMEAPIVFYDVEVFPNLFLVNWKKQGAPHAVIRMINPTPEEIDALFKYRLVGFNNRRYDNHMLYARHLGWSNQRMYELSQKIVNGTGKSNDLLFGEAYNLSYTDIYDYSSKKQSLKMWEIELGLHHEELGLPWDQPVPEDMWTKVAKYCDNDVISTEAVWNATQEDFLAREILADIAEMTVNDTTNSLTTRIVFGNERNPQLNYVDLSKEFPGYYFEKFVEPITGKTIKHNMYRNIDLGLGGYVFAVPNMYGNVALLDVASLHPHSAIALNAFGVFTKNFKDLVDTRVLIKHGEFEKAAQLFGGKLKKYLTDPKQAKKLSKALKIAINSVYGLTSATFPNKFKDPRNENNIIALRGALFMKTLQDLVVERGFKVAHIKTDSIKIPDATPAIIKFCMDFAKKYGYEFEHEATYERMCLVNDAVYIAKYMTKEQCIQMYGYCPEDNEKESGKWTATGTQFQIPYVFKKCFSHEPIEFMDLTETKQVKTALYLDFNENAKNEDDHNRQFVGRVGLFCPIKPGKGGALLVKSVTKKDGSTGFDAVVGTKGFRWKEAEQVKGICEDDIDLAPFNQLVNEAIETISQFCDYEWFVSSDPYVSPTYDSDGKPIYNEQLSL